MLVMPAGLSATGAGRVFAAWPDVADIVFATNDTQPWSQDDQTQASSAMRRVIAISDQSRILNALSAPKPLSRPERATTPPQAPSLFQKRWGGQTNTQKQNDPTNDTGLPLLGTGSAMFNPMPHLKNGAEQ